MWGEDGPELWESGNENLRPVVLVAAGNPESWASPMAGANAQGILLWAVRGQVAIPAWLFRSGFHLGESLRS